MEILLSNVGALVVKNLTNGHKLRCKSGQAIASAGNTILFAGGVNNATAIVEVLDVNTQKTSFDILSTPMLRCDYKKIVGLKNFLLT